MVCPVAKLSSRRWHPPLTWTVCDYPYAGTPHGYQQHAERRSQGSTEEYCDACRYAARVRTAEYRKRRLMKGGRFVPRNGQSRSQTLIGGRLKVNPIGTRRRIQSLSAIGYSYTELANMLGKNKRDVGYLAMGRFQMTMQETADQFAELFDRLSWVPSNSPVADRVARQARQKGWLPPVCWDEDEIERVDGLPSGLKWREHRKWVTEFGSKEQKERYRKEQEPVLAASA